MKYFFKATAFLVIVVFQPAIAAQPEFESNILTAYQRASLSVAKQGDVHTSLGAFRSVYQLIESSQFEVLRNWSKLTEPGSNLFNVHLREQLRNCDLQVGEVDFDSEVASIKKEIGSVLGSGESPLLALNEGLDGMLKAGLALSIQEGRTACALGTPIKVSGIGFFNKKLRGLLKNLEGLAVDYSLVVQAIHEAEEMLKTKDVQFEFVKALNSHVLASAKKKSITPVLSRIEHVASTLRQTDNFDLENSSKLANSVLNSLPKNAITPELRQAIGRVQNIKAKADQIEELSNIATASDLTTTEKIDRFSSSAENYFGRKENKALRTVSVATRVSSGQLSNSEAASELYEMYQADLTADTRLVVDSAIQISSIVDIVDESLISTGEYPDASAIAPAVLNLATTVFKADSDTSTALNVAMGLGMAYVTGNPMMAIGALTSIGGGGGKDAAAQARFEAIMAQFKQVNLKLDDLKEGQRKMTAQLDTVISGISELDQKLDSISGQLKSTRFDLLDRVNSLQRGIVGNGVPFDKRATCRVDRRTLSESLNIGGVKPLSTFSFESRVGSSGKRSQQQYQLLDFESADSTSLNNWYEACREHIASAVDSIDNDSVPELLSLYSYKFNGTPIDTFQGFREFYADMLSPLLRRPDKITAAAGRFSRSNWPARQRELFGLVASSNDLPLDKSQLATIYPNFTYLLDAVGYNNKNPLLEWLSVQEYLSNPLVPAYTMELALTNVDLLRYDGYKDPINKTINERALTSNLRNHLLSIRRLLVIAVVQQNLLAGQYFSRDLIGRLESGQLKPKDFEKLQGTPVLRRNLVIALCRKSHNSIGKNPCMVKDRQAVQALTGNSGYIKLSFSDGQMLNLKVKTKTFKVPFPTKQELSSSTYPEPLQALRLRGVLEVVNQTLLASMSEDSK